MPLSRSPVDEVILETKGRAAIIRLNRPKALNSLTSAMVRVIKHALVEAAAEPDIACVILTGEGERGLCAGGDIRLIHDAGRAGDGDVTRFWREEFPLNYAISHFPKPYIALMDGLVMGGGVGLASHGNIRIVTERTRLAMPETGIGYFPDVGATWLLPNAPGEIGTWLGLTGNEIGAEDAIHAGLADVHVPSATLLAMIDAFSKVQGEGEVKGVVEQFATPAASGFLRERQALIDAVFRFDSVEEIVSALEAMDDAFAVETLQTLWTRSPTSLKLTLRLLRLGRESSGLVECLEREFRAAAEVLRQHDFYEGVRAAIIDKDRNPQWKPASLDDVSSADLDRYFSGKTPVLFADHRL